MNRKLRAFARRRAMSACLMLMVAMAISTAAFVSDAARGATLVRKDGVYGRVWMNEPGAQCYFPFGIANSYRTLYTYPPRVWAADRTSYRDSNWIRFRTHVVNVNTGAEITSTNWSQWSFAYDDAPAQWSGTQQSILQETDWLDATQWTGSAVARLEIEWWNQTNRVAGITAQVTYYEQLAAAGTAPEGTTIQYGNALGC